jgi:putative oxidoreductase
MMISRILVSAIFLLNAVGIIDQSVPAKEMAERGVPTAFVPLLMLAGRILEFVAGAASALGVFPQLAALTLLAFILSATFISHALWLSVGKPNFQSQLVNFFKNLTTCGAFAFYRCPARPANAHTPAVLRNDRGTTDRVGLSAKINLCWLGELGSRKRFNEGSICVPEGALRLLGRHPCRSFSYGYWSRAPLHGSGPTIINTNKDD